MRLLTLTGQRETSDSAIVASVGLAPEATLLGVDPGAVRTRIEALPWVTEARVRKVLPGTLEVTIAEAEAVARWRYRGAEVLIAADGTVLADEVPAAFRHLPLVAGRGANGAVLDADALLAAHPKIAARTGAAVYVNERRWDLRLAGGATVRLPAEGASAALDRLAGLERRGALLAAGPVVVDLRLSDRTTVELAPPEAADIGEPQVAALPRTVEADDPLAAAIAEATASSLGDDPLAAAIEANRQEIGL